MKQAGIIFSVLFVALILAPGLAAWFFGLRRLTGKQPLSDGSPVLEFPSQNVVHAFPRHHEETDAA